MGFWMYNWSSGFLRDSNQIRCLWDLSSSVYVLCQSVLLCRCGQGCSTPPSFYSPLVCPSVNVAPSVCPDGVEYRAFVYLSLRPPRRGKMRTYTPARCNRAIGTSTSIFRGQQREFLIWKYHNSCLLKSGCLPLSRGPVFALVLSCAGGKQWTSQAWSMVISSMFSSI